MKISIDFEDFLIAEASLREDIEKTAQKVSKELGISKSKVLEALNEPSVKKTIRAFGGMANIAKAGLHTTGLAAKTMKKPFEHIANTKAMQKVHSGTMKVDELLTKYPKLKSLTGLALAGIMYQGWTLMTFMGDPDYDFDFTGLAEYVSGEKGIADFVSSSDGLMFGALFATGAGAGIGFAWAGASHLNTGIALTYTGAKHLKNKTGKELLKKLEKNVFIKGMKDTAAKAASVPKEFGVKIRRKNWWYELNKESQESYIEKHPKTNFEITSKE